MAMLQADKLKIAKNLRMTINNAVPVVSAFPQIISRTDLPDEEAIEYTSLYPEFEVGKDYKQNEMFQYNGELYRVAQAHTSQAQWVPGSAGTESLYYKVTIDEETGYEEWKQPTGAHDAYNTGDRVVYNDKVYESLIDGNTWAPDAYPDGWKLVEEDSTDQTETTEPVEPEPEPEPTPTYEEWKQPTGAHDAYSTGDIVSHNGKLWISTANSNVWEPGVYGWTEYTA